jgi:hypothetical protein
MRMLNTSIRAKDGTEYRLMFVATAAGSWHEVDGVHLPQRFELHEPLTPDRRFPAEEFTRDAQGWRWRLAFKGVSYNFVLDDVGFPRCETVTLGLWGVDSDVTASDLRRVRIDYARASAIEFFEAHTADGPHGFADTLPPDHVAGAAQRIARRRTIVTPEVLQAVADVYTRALATGRPTRAVAEHFGVAVRTASLRVKQAHEAGLITAMARESSREKGQD